jgi:hypothetical protein
MRNMRKPTVANNIAAMNGPFGIVTKLDHETYTNLAPKKTKTVTVEDTGTFPAKASNYGMMEYPES